MPSKRRILPENKRLLTLDEMCLLKAAYVKDEGKNRPDIADYVLAVRDTQDTKTRKETAREIFCEPERLNDWNIYLIVDGDGLCVVPVNYSELKSRYL